MSRYDGLIIPRSYSEYINKTDAATLLQALQQSGVMDAAPTSGSDKPVKSKGLVPADTVETYNMKSVSSNAVASNCVKRDYKLLRTNEQKQTSDTNSGNVALCILTYHTKIGLYALYEYSGGKRVLLAGDDFNSDYAEFTFTSPGTWTITAKIDYLAIELFERFDK